MVDPGGGGGGGGNFKYDGLSMYRYKTSEPANSGASSGSYAGDSIIAAWSNRTVTAIGPMNGRYDPELAAVFGEEI